MRLTRRVIINTVAFLVLGMFLVLLLAVQVLPTVFGSTYPIYAEFTAAGGVAPNQEVTYRGVQVGRVGRMTLTRDAVRIELIINSGFKIPKEGTRARVLFKSAVGEQFVDILPQQEGAPLFTRGDVIPVWMTSIPIQTEDLLRELDAVLRSVDPKALGTLVHEIGTGLRGHGQDLNKTIKALDVLTSIAATKNEQTAGILRNGAAVQGAFNASSEDFVRGIAALRTVADVLAARKAELERTLKATAGLDTEILALLRDRGSELNQIVADLGKTIRTTHDNLSNVDQLLTYLGPFLGDAVKAFDAPYFVFNLVSNTESPACTYNPSSRPGSAPSRSVIQTDATTPKEPIGNFACAGTAASASSTAVSPLPEALQIQLDRISWLQLFTLGY